ncbi:hypothetical protein AB0M54_05960 [Actinoplanes sp. NPDC051470]|uniref:hypothetical protein n=1 Tax=Actinoplanes sp. NPDC051470 TaxID=3157224 RepID=UPI0034411704
MERALTTAAIDIVLGYFRRTLFRTPDPKPDRTAERTLGVLDRLARDDPATHAALASLRAWPDDPAALALLSQRVAAGVQHHRRFKRDLSRSLGSTGPGPRRFVAAAGPVLLVVVAALGGWSGAYLRGHTTLLDVETTLTSADGWTYRVSEAHLKTSPAAPGRRYLYLDITVENRRDDREAPAIGFHFAREATTLAAGCGAQQTGWFRPIVPGWCVSRSAGLFGRDPSCSGGPIPAGGRSKVRCVDAYLVDDGFDLTTLRVYHSGGRVTEIPTST